MLDKIKKALGSKSDDKKKKEDQLPNLGESPVGVGSGFPQTSPATPGQSVPSTGPTGVSPTSSANPPTGQVSGGTMGTAKPATPQQGGAVVGGMGSIPASPGQKGPADLSQPVEPPSVTPAEETKLKQKVQGTGGSEGARSVNDALKSRTGVGQTMPSSPVSATPPAPQQSVSEGTVPVSGPKAPGQPLPVSPIKPVTSTPASGTVGGGEQSSSVSPIGKTATPGIGAAETKDEATSSLPGSSHTAQPLVPGSQPGATGAGASISAGDDELKKTHEPVVVLPDRLEMGQIVMVKVKAGMIPHVMEDTHYIQSIELFANDQSIGKKELNPKGNKISEADFQISLAAGMKLKAVIYCNMHGKWEVEQIVGSGGMPAAQKLQEDKSAP